MSRNLSNAAKQALYAQHTSEVFVMLLTIDHSNFTQPIRLSSDPTQVLPDAGVLGTISRSEEYIYLPFAVSLPGQDDTGIARASLSVDNVSREIVAAVRQADSAVSISMEILLASDLENPEVTVSDFRLESVTYDALTVTGEISVEYYDLEPFPARRYTPSDFPGIF